MTSKTFRRSVNYKIDNRSYKNGKLDYQNSNTTEDTYTSTVIGEENPRWREHIRKGLNATTHLLGVQRERLPCPVTGWLTYSTPKARGSDRWDSYLHQDQTYGLLIENPSGFSVSQADKLARQKFVSNYRDLRSAFQGGVFLGELAELVGMIKNPAKALRSGIDMYYGDVKKRLRKRNNRNQKKIVAETWLEYSFGWAPTIRQVADISKIATASPYVATQIVQGTGKQDWKSQVSRAENSASGLGQFKWNEYFRSNNAVSVRYRGAIAASNRPPGFPEQLGFSWSNLVPTIWELIPYSFLVDYFLNVGAVVEGISTGNIYLQWGAKTVRKEAVGEYLADFRYEASKAAVGAVENFAGFVHGSGSPGHYKDVERSKINTVSFGFSNEDNMFKLPGSGLKWLNIAGLAAMRR